MTTNNIKKYSPKDFKSDQEIRWCPGCGDSAIYVAVTKALAQMGIPHEKIVFISGIGCSSRFPYYLSTYGFHSIHGRAAAIASGVKVSNPDLDVWVITGDGDALAIGGNHFIHTVRRNIDMKIILFNNQIYGLTKGQYSPTSNYGTRTKTSPYGTVEPPFRPGELTIGAQGTFFARGVDNNVKFTTELMLEAEKHKGTAVVEMLQNCVIFNDGAHAAITNKETRDDNQIILKHGEPMIFGKNKDKGLVAECSSLKVVKIGEDGYTENDILVHDAHNSDTAMHTMLSNMSIEDGYPVALGVIRAVKRPVYNEEVHKQVSELKQKSKIQCMDDLFNIGNTWTV